MITRLAVCLFVLSTFLAAQAPPVAILQVGWYDETLAVWVWDEEPPLNVSIDCFRLRIHAPVGTWVGVVAHAIPDGTISGAESKARVLRAANPFAREIELTGAGFAPYLAGTNLISTASVTAMTSPNLPITVNPILLKKEIQGFSGDGLSESTNSRADAVKRYGMEVCSSAPVSGTGFPAGYRMVEWRANAENWVGQVRPVSAATHYNVSTGDLWTGRLMLNHAGLENEVISTAWLARDLFRDQAHLLFPGNIAYADTVFDASLEYGFKLSFHAIALDPPAGGAANPPQFRPIAVSASQAGPATRGADNWRNMPPLTPFPPGFSISAPTVLVFLGHPPLDGDNFFRVPVAPWLPMAFYGEREQAMVFRHPNALQIDTMLMPDQLGGLIPMGVLGRDSLGFPLQNDELAVKVPAEVGFIGYAYGWNSVTNTLIWPYVPYYGQNPVPDAGLLFYDGTPLW